MGTEKRSEGEDPASGQRVGTEDLGSRGRAFEPRGPDQKQKGGDGLQATAEGESRAETQAGKEGSGELITDQRQRRGGSRGAQALPCRPPMHVPVETGGHTGAGLGARVASRKGERAGRSISGSF